MAKRTRHTRPRKYASARLNPTRVHPRVPKTARDGQRIALEIKGAPKDKRPTWLKEHGISCNCIACFNFKPEVLAIYTGDHKHPYRCPYCGAYSPNSKEIKVHMGKIPNLMATCPQLATGIFEAGKVQYRDSGDMRLLDA